MCVCVCVCVCVCGVLHLNGTESCQWYLLHITGSRIHGLYETYVCSPSVNVSLRQAFFVVCTYIRVFLLILFVRIYIHVYVLQYSVGPPKVSTIVTNENMGTLSDAIKMT